MPSIIDQIYLLFRGEQLAVLGARGTGKSTISKLMRTNTFDERARSTIAPEVVGGVREPFDCGAMSGRTHQLTLRRGLDVEGSKPQAQLESWREALDGSTAILYLVKLSQLEDETYRQLVEHDAAKISEMLQGQRANKRRAATLVGTFLDKDPGHLAGDERGLERYERELADHEAIRVAAETLGRSLSTPPGFVAGSLDSATNARNLACRALQVLGW